MANRMMLNREERTFPRARMLEDVSLNPEGLTEEGDHCVILCKKLRPNVFFIKSGLLIIDENKGLVTPESLSVTCLTKIVFIPE
jgi:hypothetical protein